MFYESQFLTTHFRFRSEMHVIKQLQEISNLTAAYDQINRDILFSFTRNCIPNPDST